jgi:biopolymer transport protein ExbB/TolQ
VNTRVDQGVPQLLYRTLDPEARLGLPAGRGTTPSGVSCLLFTVASSTALYGISYLVREGEWGAVVWRYITAFGGIPIPITIFSVWSVVFLVLKALKIRAQRQAMRLAFVPEDTGFVLNASTADAVVEAIDRAVDDPTRFLFLARCRNVLRMMRNLGRVSDVDEILASRADQDDGAMDSGYTILRGMVWAIPVLGFIGTVVGLTQTMAEFGAVLDSAGNMAELTENLKKVLSGLETAFVTTAEALIAVIFIYLAQTLVRRADEELLDDMRAACSNAVVARVRIGRTES